MIDCIEIMHGGEVFVPKIPSMKMTDLAKALAPEAQIDVIGIRPGEKLHEVLISEDEARTTIELEDKYIVQPAEEMWFGQEWSNKGRKMEDGFRYASNTNSDWLGIPEIQKIVQKVEIE